MLVVQCMMGSRYSNFKKESLAWHRSLSIVSDVMAMLNGIQVLLREGVVNFQPSQTFIPYCIYW